MVTLSLQKVWTQEDAEAEDEEGGRKLSGGRRVKDGTESGRTAIIHLVLGPLVNQWP